MKVIILLLIFALSGVFGVGLLVQAPYHAYHSFVKEGFNGDLLKVEAPNKRLLTGNLVVKEKTPVLDTDSLWQELEFGDYLLPFPISHPSVKIVPTPRIQGKEVFAEFKYVDNNNEDLISFKSVDVKKSDFTFPTDKLFKLPLVRKYIQRKGRVRVWADMFNRNLNVKYVSIFDFSNFKNMLKYVTPLDLAYNVYIYKMRRRFFPKGVIKTHFINASHIVFIIDSKDSNEEIEGKLGIGRYLKNGKVYTYHLNISRSNTFSDLIQQRIFKSLRVEDSRAEFSSQKIYSQFKSLPYSQRISVDGLVYLYSAWSHELENKAFMRELIQFMERGKGHESFLFPLYDFSMKKWGSSFSTRDRYLKEDAKNKLARGIKGEKKKEEKELDNFDSSELDFQSKEEKLDYLLKKAKRKKRSKKPSPSSDSVIEN